MAIKWQTFSSDQRPNLSIDDLSRALELAAVVVGRYAGSQFENHAICLFERLEEEIEFARRKSSARERARDVLLRGRDAGL